MPQPPPGPDSYPASWTSSSSSLTSSSSIDARLTFDLVDTWSSRSLGGFSYHVVHPGGRSYDDHPVNAMAAEARRASRFEALGHTAGRIDLGPLPAAGAEYPATTDLRRFLPGDR